ncbi:MAG: hypothetical protein LAP38_12465 [Acidobacteriia bacterium]|nr:hypothetical protein [Terriglobia bacterium]
MSEEANPNDPRFAEIESTLERLINSQRQLLHAQVIMADGLNRTEKNLERVSEAIAAQAEAGKRTDQRLEALAEQIQKLADGQKHSDEHIDALADIVRQLIERNGKNGH